MPRDYYLVLGITSDASLTDIKDAYRRLAKTYHPDHYKGNSGPFQDIQEAYDVLSDPDRRKDHDAKMKIHRPARTGPTFSAPLEPLIPETREESFFRPDHHRVSHTYPPFSGQPFIIRFRF
ncbi:MAG: DnaJ domain-containing protein [Desulfotignum sp.]|nr:DnaJ domain-containing protein [Desulfotignum sp.]